MRSFVTSSLIGLTLAAAAPAAARTVGTQIPTPAPRANPFIGDSRLPGPGIGRELNDIRGRVERARENGALSRTEARQLRREVRLIGRLAHRYGRDGLSPYERSELQTRAQVLRAAVNRPGNAGGKRDGQR